MIRGPNNPKPSGVPISRNHNTRGVKKVNNVAPNSYIMNFLDLVSLAKVHFLVRHVARVSFYFYRGKLVKKFRDSEIAKFRSWFLFRRFLILDDALYVFNEKLVRVEW